MSARRVLWCAAAVVFFATTIRALDDGRNRWRDGQFFHVAGKVWLAGGSPYDYDAFHAEWEQAVPAHLAHLGRSFVYPPTTVLLAVPLGALPYPAARVLYDCLNLLALVGSAALVARLLGVGWAGPAALAALSISAWQLGTLHLGQTALLALVGILGTFWAHREGRPAVGALAVLLASTKPQLSALPLLWLLWQGGWRPLLHGGALCAAASLLAILPAGFELPHQMEESLAQHIAIPFNSSLGRWPLHTYDLPAIVPLVLWAVHFEVHRTRVLSAYRRKMAVDGFNGRVWRALEHEDAERELAALGEVFPSTRRSMPSHLSERMS